MALDLSDRAAHGSPSSTRPCAVRRWRDSRNSTTCAVRRDASANSPPGSPPCRDAARPARSRGSGSSASPATTASPPPRSRTAADGHADRVRDLLGTGPAGTLADLAAAGVRVVDVAVDSDAAHLPPEVEDRRIRRGSGRIDVEDALTRRTGRGRVRPGHRHRRRRGGPGRRPAGHRPRSRPARRRRPWRPSSPRRRSPPSSAGVHSSTTAADAQGGSARRRAPRATRARREGRHDRPARGHRRCRPRRAHRVRVPKCRSPDTARPGRIGRPLRPRLPSASGGARPAVSPGTGPPTPGTPRCSRR